MVNKKLNKLDLFVFFYERQKTSYRAAKMKICLNAFREHKIYMLDDIVVAKKLQLILKTFEMLCEQLLNSYL